MIQKTENHWHRKHILDRNITDIKDAKCHRYTGCKLSLIYRTHKLHFTIVRCRDRIAT